MTARMIRSADATDATDAAAISRRSRIARYGLWQLRDYAMDRGLPTVIVAVMFGYMGVAPMLKFSEYNAMPAREIAKYGSLDAARAAFLAELSGKFLGQFLGAIVFLGALFAMNGIVANDRKLGFYKFLFSKPVSPSRYYGQAFLVNSAGFVVVLTLLALLYGWFVVPVLDASFLVGLAAIYLCYAGIAFLLSSAARWDWLSLVTVTVAANYLWGRYGASPAAVAKLLYLLPPVHRSDKVYAAVAEHLALPMSTVAWFAGYGALAFLAALVVLRYRRMALI